ncbi:hypothetical protein JTB14_005929 [Gonioctena quinquepunctata]|nr:hypothetical protein JTB14_005929 [Gonioctena quinquepunctata]
MACYYIYDVSEFTIGNSDYPETANNENELQCQIWHHGIRTSTKNGPFGVVESVKPLNNCAQEQEVNDLKEFLKLEKNKYVQYKIIYDTLEEYIKDENTVEDNLKAKVRDIMLGESLAQSLTLDYNPFDKTNVSLLGESDVGQSNLTYQEGNVLQEILNKKLNRKYQDITREFNSLTNKDLTKSFEQTDNSTSMQLSPEDKVLLEYKNKLTSEQEQYIKNLITLSDLLQEITDLRLKSLPETIEKKVEECQIEEKINHLKSLLSNEKCRVDVFTETSCSLKAYKELIKDIKEQQHECQKEIQYLKELQEKYKEVSCKQYDDILKSYIQYKSSIEKKKILYECLKS